MAKGSREQTQGRTQRQGEGVAQRGQQAHEDRQLLRNAAASVSCNFAAGEGLMPFTVLPSRQNTCRSAWMHSTQHTVTAANAACKSNPSVCASHSVLHTPHSAAAP